jgi:hypothetical protein
MENKKKWPVVYKNGDLDNPITLYKWIDVSPSLFESLFIYETHDSELMYGIDTTNDEIFVLVIHRDTWGNERRYTRTTFTSFKEAKRFACKLVPFVFPEAVGFTVKNYLEIEELYPDPEGPEKSLEDMDPDDECGDWWNF